MSITSELFSGVSYDTTRVKNLYDSLWFYYDREDYEKTIRYSSELIELTKNSDYQKLKNVYNLLSVIYQRQGRYSLGLNYGKLAVNNSNDHQFNSLVYINIANIYADMGDIKLALTYYQNALDNSDTLNFSLKAYILNNIGYSYYKINQWRKAIEYYTKAISINEKYHQQDIGFIYNNCARAYFNLGDFKNASFYYNLSIIKLKKENGENHPKTAMAFVNYAVFLSRLEQYDEAIIYFKKAEKIFNKTVGQKHFYTFTCQFNFGKHFLAKGEYEPALQHFQKALISRVYQFNDTDVFHNPSSGEIPDANLIEALKYKSQALEGLYRRTRDSKYLIHSFSVLEKCTGFMERLRTGYLSEYSKLTLSSNEHEVYSSLIRISHELYQLTHQTEYLSKSFEYSERSKYGVLREVRNDLFARSYAGVPDSITIKERELKERIISLQLKTENEPGDENLNSELFSLMRAQDELIGSIENSYPQYYRSKYDNRVASPAEIQKKLKHDQALVEYALTDHTLYIFTITCDTFALVTVPADTGFFNSLNLHSLLLHSSYTPPYTPWRKASYNLYRSLILPIEEMIGGKELIIVPDAALASVSFEPLTTEPYKENIWHMYEDEPYLLYQFPISYSFSATLFTNETGQKNRKRFAGFAPDYSHSPDSLLPLPEGMKNVKKLAKLFLGKSFTAEKATKENFMKSMDEYRILYLFAHGIEDSVSSSMSKIFFEGDTAGKGYMYSHEVSNSYVDAELIVLLSCYSGSGNVSEGEGILSMGRSFFNSGVNSMVMSLWSASSGTSIDIISDFYLNLLKGKNKTRALQNAKINYLKKGNPIGVDPRYWSSLVLIGNPDALFRFYIFKIAGLAVLLVSITIFLIFRKKLLKLF